MTLPWLICSSLLLATSAFAATVSGTVELTGSPARSRDLSGVVIWLAPISPDSHFEATARFTMVQKDKRFTPHILAVPVGATVAFPNFDPIFHNAFSSYNGQIFDTALYPPHTSRSVQFHREGVVRVFCNIHPSMSAVIVVMKSSWFATSGPTGSFQIPNVPPGEYLLRLFHERSSEAQLQQAERRVTVGPADLSVPAIVISESGYIALPHKNKFGKDYPPENRNSYDGAPRD